MNVDAMIKHHQAVTEVITHAMSDYASAATGTSWNKACFAFEADAILCALSRAGFRILGPDEVDQVTVEYEIWTVGDEPELCASTTDLADAYHYALVYGQDGLVEIVELTRRALGRKE